MIVCLEDTHDYLTELLYSTGGKYHINKMPKLLKYCMHCPVTFRNVLKGEIFHNRDKDSLRSSRWHAVSCDVLLEPTKRKTGLKDPGTVNSNARFIKSALYQSKAIYILD